MKRNPAREFAYKKTLEKMSCLGDSLNYISTSNHCPLQLGRAGSLGRQGLWPTASHTLMREMASGSASPSTGGPPRPAKGPSHEIRGTLTAAPFLGTHVHFTGPWEHLSAGKAGGSVLPATTNYTISGNVLLTLRVS